MKEEGYYYAIDKGKTVIVEYRIEGCHGYLYMTGTDEMFAESEFDDVDFESCINVVLGSVSNQRELLIAFCKGLGEDGFNRLGRGQIGSVVDKQLERKVLNSDRLKELSSVKIDIQKEEFDYIDCVEPNLSNGLTRDELESTSLENIEILELYEGDNVVRVTKEDVEKFSEHFK